VVRVTETAAHTNPVWLSTTRASPVHLATVPDLDDEHQNVAITDLVQHAVVTDSDSEIVGAAGELLAARWARVGR